MNDKKREDKRTALIRFADRYFILAALVYSLKCRMPTNTRNFRCFCAVVAVFLFHCRRMIHIQSYVSLVF